MAAVSSFSSQYIHESFHATQVVGPYDLYPAYGDKPNARGQGTSLDTYRMKLGNTYINAFINPAYGDNRNGS